MNSCKLRINRRFLHVLELLINTDMVRSEAEFYHNIGCSASKFHDIKKYVRPVTIDMLPPILELYPVNPYYILIGKGDPLVEGTYSLTREIPLVKGDVWENYPKQFQNPGYNVKLSNVALSADLFEKGHEYRAFEMTNQSMFDAISIGDCLIGKRIRTEEAANGIIHVVVTKNEMVTRRLFKNSIDSNSLMLESENDFHTPMVNKNDIMELWAIVLKITSCIPDKSSTISSQVSTLQNSIVSLSRELNKIKEN